MRLLKHEYTEDGLLQYTTDPLVMFDYTAEIYEVQVDEKTVASFYGGYRATRAYELAALIRAGYFGTRVKGVR